MTFASKEEPKYPAKTKQFAARFSRQKVLVFDRSKPFCQRRQFVRIMQFDKTDLFQIEGLFYIEMSKTVINFTVLIISASFYNLGSFFEHWVFLCWDNI